MTRFRMVARCRAGAVLIGVLAAALLALTIAGCGSGGKSDDKAIGVADTSRAEKAASALTGHPTRLSYRESQSYLGGVAERFSDQSAPGVDYYFDPATGRVVRLDDFRPVAGAVRLTIEEARQAAETFARDHVPFFSSGLELRSSTDASSNSSAPGIFAFQWGRREGATGAWLPTFLTMEVDGSSGAVKSFNAVDVPVSIATTPKISKDAALAIVHAAPGVTTAWQDEKAELVVECGLAGDANGRQVLVWAVTAGVRTENGQVTSVRILVDAQTGKVLSVDGF